MKIMIIATALLCLGGSSFSAARPPMQLLLRDIQKGILNVADWCNSTTANCSEIMVQQAIPEHQKKLSQADVFCNAAAALRKVKATKADAEVKLMGLADKLIINGSKKQHGKPIKCALNEDGNDDLEVDLNTFLKSLLAFTREQYKNTPATKKINDRWQI